MQHTPSHAFSNSLWLLRTAIYSGIIILPNYIALYGTFHFCCTVSQWHLAPGRRTPSATFSVFLRLLKTPILWYYYIAELHITSCHYPYFASGCPPCCRHFQEPSLLPDLIALLCAALLTERSLHTNGAFKNKIETSARFAFSQEMLHGCMYRPAGFGPLPLFLRRDILI